MCPKRGLRLNQLVEDRWGPGGWRGCVAALLYLVENLGLGRFSAVKLEAYRCQLPLHEAIVNDLEGGHLLRDEQDPLPGMNSAGDSNASGYPNSRSATNAGATFPSMSIEPKVF